MFNHLTPDECLHKAFEIYRAALSSSHYGEKYASCKAPADESSWCELPFLTPQELYVNTYPHSTRMLTRPVEGMVVSSTGGSSGIARYTVLTHEEWDIFSETQARALRLLGIERNDLVANLFVAGHLWPSFIGVHDAIKYLGAVHLPISANIPPEEILRLCVEFDPQVMLSLPTLFVFLADLAIKGGHRFPSLRLLGYAGEQMSQQAQQHVQRGLDVKEIRALAYSSADAGLMGYQCPHCDFATYHWPTDFQLLEIIEPLSGRAAKPGQEGELIVTNLARRSMPIIRYRIGDVGTFLKEKCPCGDPNSLFRLAGRAGEDFKLGGAYISMKVIDECLSEFSDSLSLNYMVEIEDIANQMDFRVLVEVIDQGKAREIEDELKDAIGRLIPEITVGLEKDYIRNFEIRFVELGKLPRNPVSGKIKKLNDKRTRKK